MNVEAFLLCDAATNQQGKLNVLGAFDNISTRKLPAIYPACSIVARIRFEKIEEGLHTVRILVIDEDANFIGPKLQGNINVRMGEYTDSITSNLIINIQRLKFDRYGTYRTDLAVDGEIRASLPLRVTEAPNQPQ